MQVNEHFKKYTIFFCTSKEQPNINVQKIKKKSEKSLNLIGKKRFCTCNKSQCNKKYCECFSKGKKCNENFCSCSDCHNKMNLNKNYEIKLGISCSCQKSKCSKKYCECYNNGKKCNICCSCMDCKNKKQFIIEENSFFALNNLKKIIIRNENIIIDNYRLSIKN